MNPRNLYNVPFAAACGKVTTRPRGRNMHASALYIAGYGSLELFVCHCNITNHRELSAIVFSIGATADVIYRDVVRWWEGALWKVPMYARGDTRVRTHFTSSISRDAVTDVC